jgi:hypothetical protein
VSGDRYEEFRRGFNGEGQHPWLDSALREVELAATGVVGGLKQGWEETKADPLGGGLRLAGSVGLGLAFGALRAETGMVRLGAEIGASALTASLVADVLTSRKTGMFLKAASDTWKSDQGFDRNKEIAKETLGRFAFDTASMALVGLGTAKLTQRYMMPRNEVTVAEMLKNLTEKEGIKWHNGRPVPTTLANSFENFPVKAKSYIETGKDSIVIELADNTVLKVMREPLKPGLGSREFDLPILRQGTVGGGASKYQFIVQPKVEVVQDRAVANAFGDQIRPKGFNFWDRDPSQLGMYKGQVKLLDYDAVSKFTVGPHAKG